MEELGEDEGWSDLEEHEGALRLSYRQEFSHALTFRFYSHDDDEWEIEADVKWDSCVNWRTNPDYLYHFCTLHDVVRLGRTFEIAWAITRDKLPTAHPDLFPASIVLDAR